MPLLYRQPVLGQYLHDELISRNDNKDRTIYILLWTNSPGTRVGAGGRNWTLVVKKHRNNTCRRPQISKIIFLTFLLVGTKYGGILEIRFLGTPEVVKWVKRSAWRRDKEWKKDVRAQVYINYGHLRLQTPPRPEHVNSLDQFPE